MTPDEWQKVKSTYDALLDCESGIREDLLAELCGDDDEDLQREVQLLMAQTQQSRAVLSAPVWDKVGISKGSLSSHWWPQTIGRYRVIRLVGEGGMGSVYEAEQDLPRRTVAL